MMWCDGSAQRFAQVPQKVPAVCNLHGLRSRPACGFGVDPATVAANDFGPGMPPEPCSDGVRVAIREQINYLARLQIAQDRAIAMALAPSPVVDAKHTWSLNESRRPVAMKLTQQSRPACQQTETYP